MSSLNKDSADPVAFFKVKGRYPDYQNAEERWAMAKVNVLMDKCDFP
jgi:hypothetical protein